MAQDLFGTPIIDDFHDGVHDFLSNFYLAPVEVWGSRFPSTEHAFQWAKTDNPTEKMYVLWQPVRLVEPPEWYSADRLFATTPGQAKRRGKEVTLKDNWNEIRYDIMLEVCRAKFEQHPDLAAKLIATGESELIEGNNWHDNTWGACICENCAKKEKLNLLGKVLMQIRTELCK